jgi:FkbM family methyltransferase
VNRVSHIGNGVGRFATAYIPHVGWLRHEPGEEVISLLRQGYFEASEQAFYWLYLRPADTFIDCGAHIGLYSIIASRATDGETHVIAIEPSGETANHLEFNLTHSGMKGAHIIRSAIWMASGQIQFINKGAGKAAYAHAAFGEGVGGISISTVTLDQIVKDAGVKEVALVKIDVEGAEPEALKGGQYAIEHGLLPVLMVEFTEQNLQQRGLSTQDLILQLRKLDYTLCEFSQAMLELVPYSLEGPIWFKNLFACRDLKQVNARLRSASEDNKTIARDILGRAAACSRFKELEELDRYRSIANEVDHFRQRVENAEARLALAQQAVVDNHSWAVRTEQLLAQERQTNAELHAWAERTEAQLKQAHQAIDDNRAWAERTEAQLKQAHQAIDDNRAWAERTEELLAQERTKVIPLKAFAQLFKCLYKMFVRYKREA